MSVPSRNTTGWCGSVAGKAAGCAHRGVTVGLGDIYGIATIGIRKFLQDPESLEA